MLPQWMEAVALWSESFWKNKENNLEYLSHVSAGWAGVCPVQKDSPVLFSLRINIPGWQLDLIF
jgi:hypothetical protein